MIRRINIWGGPSVGKTGTATWLYANLKILGYKIHFSEEQAKKLAYQNIPIKSFKQMYLTVCQIDAEDTFLFNGVDYIITDAPVPIGYCFALRDKLDYADTLLKMSQDFEKKYPSINIYLERKIPYKKDGRYEEESEAKLLDEIQLRFLENYEFIITSPLRKEELLTKIIKMIS